MVEPPRVSVMNFGLLYMSVEKALSQSTKRAKPASTT